MRRLGGLLAAALLVVAGLGIRSLRSDGGDDAGAAGSGDGPAATALRCVPELADLCRAFDDDVIVEPAAETYALLTSPGSDAVPWVTMTPWPAMVDDQRRRSGMSPLFADVEPVAVTEMVWVGWEERLDVLEASCGLTWDCLVSEGQWSAHGGPAAWGRVQVGIGDPDEASDGARTLTWATGVDDDRVAGDPEVTDVLDRLADRIPDLDPPAGSALAQMLVTGPAGFDVAVTPRAIGQRMVDASARAGTLDVAVVDPAATVGVVIAGPGVRSLSEDLRARLLADGWVAPDQLEGRAVDGGQAIAVWQGFEQVSR